MAMSKQKKLLLIARLIVIVSVQACLIDARRLRVAGKSAIVHNLDTNDLDPSVATTDSTTTTASVDPNTVPTSNMPSDSCSPDKNQLKYYSGLYSSNVANSFNGNILYYALKAVDIHNRSNSTITEEDRVAIANISDHNRFTPAGMETANKAVCAKILQEMDEEASLFSTTALCAWDYICDYKADRYPHYLFKARCKTSKCNGNCNQSTNKHNVCESHGIHVTILEKRENCNEWVWGQDLLPLACTCTNDLMMKAENMSG